VDAAKDNPGQRLRVGLDIVARQQPGVRKTPGEIVQDSRDFGERTAVDDQRGNLAFRVQRQIVRRSEIVALERHRLAVEGRADLVQRDMHRHRTRSRREI
jgi:hypothetical protein